LAPENNRKSVIWYATLLEFGTRLCHQELWFCLASIQASVSKLVPARLAGLTRLLVRDMLCGDRAMDTAGIILPVGRDGRHELVRFRYHATGRRGSTVVDARSEGVERTNAMRHEVLVCREGKKTTPIEACCR